MSDNSVRVGSIIHLESVDANGESGGFLNQLGWVTDIPVITHFHDPHIRALVTTHEDKNRSDGSGSWQILSADPEKKPGDELKSGDKIHLLNMQPGAGYLDTFEWVQNLEPFRNYPMTTGVFTATVPNRGGGVSGTWTIYADAQAANLSAGPSGPRPIKITDTITLKNDYPGAGFLFAYSDGDQAVHQHDFEKGEKRIFADYDGARKFVFAGQAEQHGKSGASYTWKVIPVGLSERLYRIENQWGDDQKAPWHEAGIFKFGFDQKDQIVRLHLSRAEQKPDTLTGFVQFKGDTATYTLTAEPGERPNRYAVSLDHSNNEHKEAWLLGSREYQRLTSLEIEDQDGTGVLLGKVEYEGERPIRIRATPGTDDQDILYDYFHPDLLKGRTQKLQGVIDTTYRLLSDTIESFRQIQQKKTADPAAENDSGQSTAGFPEGMDVDFQTEQLQNLLLLSELLNAFYAYKLKPLMKQSFKNHRKDQTLAPLHLVRQSFQQLATDHEMIQQAAVQRRWTHGVKGKDDGFFMSEQALELLIMDKLAMKAITPFKQLLAGNGDQNDLAIISYLSERTHIRHLPYTDQFILIGVSYDRVPQAGSLFDDRALFERPFHAFELMAIPHEIGHYIYEHGKLPNGRTFPDVCKQFQGNNPYYRWGEELFADLIGCIVAGPLTVLSMRALLVSINRERAWKDDEHHPTPVLRVFILNEIMRILKDIQPEKYDFSDVVDKLDEDWATILESWGYARVGQPDAQAAGKRPARIYLHDNAAIHLEQIVNVDRVINAIRPIIVEFASLLLAQLEQQNDASDQQTVLDVTVPWVSAATAPGKVPEAKLDAHSQAMRQITSREFALKKVGHQVKLTINIDKGKPDMTNPEKPGKQLLPDELLQIYLENWGKEGPTGSGGGTYY